MKAILGSILLALLLGCASKNIYPAKSMDTGQIMGTWFGSTAGDVHFYRLDLSTIGSGFFGSVYWTNPPQVYRISNWKLQDDEVLMALEPLEKAFEPIALRGETVGQTIELFVSGNSWRHRLTLRREDVFESSLGRLRHAMSVERRGN